jgi:hypothetical protein
MIIISITLLYIVLGLVLGLVTAIDHHLNS